MIFDFFNLYNYDVYKIRMNLTGGEFKASFKFFSYK